MKSPARYHKERFSMALKQSVNIGGLVLSLLMLKIGLWSLLGIHPYSLDAVSGIQCLYSIELINSFFGITTQSFLPSLLQIASRVFISSCACSYENRAVTSLMFIAWGVSDSLRFLYYFWSSLRNVRYLASFALYPLGVLCEVYLMLYQRSLLGLIGTLVYIPGFKYLYGRIKNRVSSYKQ